VNAATGWISVEFDPAIYKFEANKILIFKKSIFWRVFFSTGKRRVCFSSTLQRGKIA
jgi:hypothetical protein